MSVQCDVWNDCFIKSLCCTGAEGLRILNNSLWTTQLSTTHPRVFILLLLEPTLTPLHCPPKPRHRFILTCMHCVVWSTQHTPSCWGQDSTDKYFSVEIKSRRKGCLEHCCAHWRYEITSSAEQLYGLYDAAVPNIALKWGCSSKISQKAVEVATVLLCSQIYLVI